MFFTALVRPRAVERPPGPPPMMTTSQSGGLAPILSSSLLYECLKSSFEGCRKIQTAYKFSMQRLIGLGLLSVTGRRTSLAAVHTAASHRETLWPNLIAKRSLKDLCWVKMLARASRWLPEAHITTLGRSPGPDQDHVTSCPASIKAAVLLSQLLHCLVSGHCPAYLLLCKSGERRLHRMLGIKAVAAVAF